MSLLEFIQLIIRHRKWIFVFPFLVGVIVFFTTGNMPHTFTSETVIYTGIASGYTPDNDFDNKLDFHAANSRFDNVINIIDSKETRKEVCLRLLAYMLHNDEARAKMIAASKSKVLEKTLSKQFVEQHRLSDESVTCDSLRSALTSGKEDEVFKMVYGNYTTPFSINTLTGVKASRLANSDMLKITFTCEDAFTCKKTLDLTTEIFLKKYQDVRIGEADVALKYFTEQTAEAKARLQLSEERLKNFRSNNGVINYYEQTKYVADQKDDLEKNETRLRMDLEGYQSALARVEQKLGSRNLLQLQNEKIIKTRNELALEFQKKGIESVKEGVSKMEGASISDLKEELKKNVQTTYELSNTVEGLPTGELLDQWIQLTLNTDETQSRIKVLVAYEKEFEKVFARFAPLGSDLNKLERDVDVSEKEYLNLLHSLSQAILRKNNLSASESVSIVDTAGLPLTPNPSKRILLIVISVIGCSVFSIVILIIRTYMDQSVASPLRLLKLTGINTVSAFPSNGLDPEALDEMNKRALDRLSDSLNHIFAKDLQRVFVIGLNTTGESKSEFHALLDMHLVKNEIHWNLINETKVSKQTEVFPLIINSDKIQIEQFTSLMKEGTPAILFLFDASKKIDDYKMQIIDKWKDSGLPLSAVLLNVNEQEISRYLGEIPKKRSQLRTFMKRQILRYAS